MQTPTPSSAFFNIYTLGLLLLVMAVAYYVASKTTEEPGLKADPDNSAQVLRGQELYQRFCSTCHGDKLQGESNWRIRNADGKLPAPPHDESGHTWHHPDNVLFGITKMGLVPPYAPQGYKSNMPAWGGTLTDEDIWAVLAFIKSQWPKEIRAQQEQINREAGRS